MSGRTDAGVGPLSFVELPAAAIAGRPDVVTTVLLQPKTRHLPLRELPPQVFETLVLRVCREVEGLRNVVLYGVPGQVQHGIDIVGDAGDQRVCVQCKRYEQFGPADLTAAVQKFDDGELPFAVTRFVVAVSLPIEPTGLANERIRLDDAHPGVSIELWGSEQISEMLRRRADIVSEFFGDQAAQLFCPNALPANTVQPPPTQHSELALAAMQGPMRSTGAEEFLKRAGELEDSNPQGAADEILAAQQRLADAGFIGHAATLTSRRAGLLGRAGGVDEAVRLLSDLFWGFVATAEMDLARSTESEMEEILNTTQIASDASRRLVALGAAAIALDADPLGGVGEVPSALLEPGAEVVIEVGRLTAILAAQSAITPYDDWRSAHVEVIEQVANALAEDIHPEARSLAVILRVEVADVRDDWTGLTARAQRRELPRTDVALVLARQAMALSEQSQYDPADAAWDEAIEQSVLAGVPAQAASWVYSRRLLASRLGHELGGLNDFHRLAQALRASGGGGASTDALLERALKAILDDKLLPAVLLLRRLLRISAQRADWAVVAEGRRHLAQAYARSGEAQAAAAHYCLAGQATDVHELAKSAGDTFLDVISLTRDTPYWTAASAFRSLSEQADLIPDADLHDVVETAIDVLVHQAEGSLVDSPIFTPRVFLEAHRLLASVSARLDDDQAERLLGFYEPLLEREPGHYFFTDDMVVDGLIGIARSNPRVRERSISNLMTLLAQDGGVAHRIEHRGVEVFDKDDASLVALASAGNPFAARIVAMLADELPADLGAQADLASAALRAAVVTAPGQWAIGTGAIQQSLLARHLDASERRELIVAQLTRVAAPYEASENRCDYLISASNLADGIDDMELFRQAVELARSGEPSIGDLQRGLTNHPLSAFRYDVDADVRPPALLLAAALARTSDQRRDVISLAPITARLPGRSDFLVAKALQRIGLENLADSIAVLAAQPSRNLRAIAALCWAAFGDRDEQLGLRLALDDDQVVRRTLASAAADQNPGSIPDAVLEVLRSDVRFSVRAAISRIDRA